jgi:hypothetical protein
VENDVNITRNKNRNIGSTSEEVSSASDVRLPRGGVTPSRLSSEDRHLRSEKNDWPSPSTKFAMMRSRSLVGDSNAQQSMRARKLHEIPVGWQKEEETTLRRKADDKVKEKASATSGTPYDFARRQTMEGSSCADPYLESKRSTQRKCYDEHIKLTEMDLSHYKRIMEKRFKQLEEHNPIKDPLEMKWGHEESKGGNNESGKRPASNRRDREPTKERNERCYG